MFRTVQQLARALASGDVNLRRSAEEFVRRLEVEPDLARNLVDERQETLDIEFPARVNPFAGPGRAPSGVPRYESLPDFRARVEGMTESIRSQRRPGPVRTGMTAPTPPRATEPSRFPIAQPRLFSEPSAIPTSARARPRRPEDATPPAPRPRVLGDEVTFARLQENEALHASAILEAMPDIVRYSIRKNFREARTADDLYRALRTYSRFKKAQGVINNVPQGRIAISGATSEAGGGGGSISLGGAAGQVVGESGISLGRGARSASSIAAGRTGADEVYNDILGVEELDELARQTAARLNMENMLPKDMKEYQQEKLLREIVSEAEVAQASLRQSDRPTLNRLKQRGSFLRSLEDINRFWSDITRLADEGKINKFDARGLRAMAEMANTRIVNEILEQSREPSGIGIARAIARLDNFSSVYSARPFEGMLAAISSARSVDELEQIRRIYLRMPRGIGFTAEQIKFFEEVVKRQNARLTMSDVDLMRMFGYTDWAYATTTKAGVERISRGVPGVEGMERIIEIPQEIPLPIAVRAANRGQQIRDKIFDMMSRRQMDYGRQESTLISDNPRFFELRRLTSNVEEQLDNIDREIGSIREYGITNGDKEIAKLEARRAMLQREMARYKEEISRLGGLKISEAAEEGLRRDVERMPEGTGPVTARDKYVAESEDDLMMRVLGYNSAGDVRTAGASRYKVTTEEVGRDFDGKPVYETATRINEGAQIQGRRLAGRLQMAHTPRDIDDLRDLIERSMMDGRVSEDFGLQLLDRLEEHTRTVAGGALWRGRPAVMDMSTAAPLDPVDPSEFGAVAFSSKSDIAKSINGGDGYEARTAENAIKGDVTISVGDTFDTGGEFLTMNYSRLNDREFLTSYAFSPDMDADVAHIVSRLNEIYKTKGEPLIINGAGNGIDKLGEGVTQSDINNYIGRLFEKIMNHPDRAFEIRGLRTGGQSGADLAWAHASRRLGFPTRVHPAYGKDVFTKGGRKLPESIMVAVGEPYGYKGSYTAYLPVEQYRRRMGFDADPYNFEYEMIAGQFDSSLSPRKIVGR
jgi:hypothetical protein